jgi:hypothetical protein
MVVGQISWKRQAARSVLFIFLLLSAKELHGQENLLERANDFDQGELVDNPWGGVSDGVLALPPGSQLAVNDEGAIVESNPGPSVAVGDLNGDGLPDLVVADARGFFWFFPNRGTPTQPRFTFGEILPIWIGNPETSPLRNGDRSTSNTVPRICLVDLDKNGLLDIVAGNSEGKLYYFRNVGSQKQPKFTMPQDLSEVLVPTRAQGVLWCNYLAPCLYDWRGGGLFDLILGEGTYSANSIYLLTNDGSNQNPFFRENRTLKIIRGMGREHLTPQVVDWNNDGKPDIITGEREGSIDLFLNTTTDPAHPQFDQGQRVKFGDSETLGQFTTVAVGDLTGNKLPNLVISNSDDHVLYAENKGTPGSPRFDFPEPIKGVNPLPKIIPALNWTVEKAFGIPYVNLVSTNKQIEAEFEPPSPDFKSALKYYTEPHDLNRNFPNTFYPQEDTQWLRFGSLVSLKSHSRYRLSFWVKSGGDISNLSYWFWSFDEATFTSFAVMRPISASGEWTHFSDSFSCDVPDKVTGDSYNYIFRIVFNGQATLYFDGFSLTEDSP